MGQNRLELALLGLIAVVCAGLSFLQYRWTGEVSRAERSRLRSGLNEQVTRFTLAFDEEIRENCRALLPDAKEIREAGIQEAHRLRYQQWTSAHERGLFSRIGIAVPERGGVGFYGLDSAGRVVPMEWPSSWQELQSEIRARVQGTGHPPSIPLHSTLLEFPVFDDSRHHEESRTEAEWMIFEVSEDYLRTQTLPHMVAEYLNAGGDAIYDLSVSWADAQSPAIFSTRPDKSSVASGADATAALFSTENGGTGFRHRRRSREETSRARWTMAVRHRDGSLDAAVSRARTRNLLTSFVLIALLAGAAWALVRYTARSRRLANMQFRFAVGVSHDLRTPLTAIRGAAFNLADGVITEPSAIKRYSQLILRNAEELTAMIENILAYSSSMHSGREERKQSFAIKDLLDHAAATMAQEIEQAGCRLELNVAPDLPTLAGDPVAIELAFTNLIANAVRHASEGRWIGVSASRQGDAVEIRVSDRGPGIQEAERERIFEPFYRGEQTRAGLVRGTGLGLSLVKDTIERHRGTITVHNSAAGGAQFTVHLPAMPHLS